MQHLICGRTSFFCRAISIQFCITSLVCGCVWRQKGLTFNDHWVISRCCYQQQWLSTKDPLCSAPRMGWAMATNSTPATALSSVHLFVPFPSRYMTPASGSVLEQVLSVQYSVVTPLLNPLIYSLKNQEVKAALRRMLTKKPRLSS